MPPVAPLCSAYSFGFSSDWVSDFIEQDKHK